MVERISPTKTNQTNSPQRHIMHISIDSGFPQRKRAVYTRNPINYAQQGAPAAAPRVRARSMP